MEYTNEQIKEAAAAIWEKMPYSYLGSFGDFDGTAVTEWCERIAIVVLTAIKPLPMEEMYDIWKPLPKEPTREMIEAAGLVDEETAKAVWGRMADAAPPTPRFFSDVIAQRKILEETAKWMMTYKVSTPEAMAETLPEISQKIFDTIFSFEEKV